MRYYAIWLSLLCIGFFIVQTFSPSFTDALILNQSSFSQPWRFVTSIFLHGSITHLLYNMFALLLFGLILENLIKGKFLLVFFISGIIGNLISVFFYPSSLGASGAIFGIIGCLAILRPGMGVFAFGLILPLWLASIIWIAGDLLGLFVPSDVGHIAHLSGVFAGIIFGIILGKGKRRNYNYRVNLPERQIREWEDAYMKERKTL